MEKFKVDGLEVTKLHDKIYVFHDMLNDPKGLIDFYIDKTEEWFPWYTFGDMMIESGPSHSWDKFPTDEEWHERITKTLLEVNPKDIYKPEVGKAWHKASSVYQQLTGTSLPQWEPTAWSLARYFPDVEPNTSTHTMNHHTDYQQDMAEAEGYQPHITGVLYVNDEYEGGEIAFRKFPDGEINSRTFQTPELDIVYKPKAGDLAVFPSNHPYYHGVKNVYKEPKYIYRLYWRVYQEASELYTSLKEKYGDKFDDIETERRKRPDNMYRDAWSQSIRIPFAEYYEKLEEGRLPDIWEPRESDKYRPSPDELEFTDDKNYKG